LTVTSMTKLDAVNICLSSMGEPKITTLNGAAVDAQIASDLIDETSRSVQSRGWYWNRDTYTLSPDVNGNIIVPSNTARVDTINGSKAVDVVVRGGKLYNRADATFTFTEPLTLEVYVFLDFNDIPYAGKQYITMRSARLFQQRVLGSPTLAEYGKEEETQAWLTLMQEEAEVGDYNMLYDSESTKQIVSRYYYGRII
jgi:hypothetical protein